MRWEDRPEKAQARNYLFGSTKFASKASLWMPAAGCLDIQLALERGILNRHSQITAVERDPTTFALMRKSLARIAKQHSLVHEPVTINAPLHKVSIDRPIDFAFIDLCGTCDAPILG